MWIIPVHAFGPSTNEIYEGIDVSVYQGDIDYAKVKSAGIQVVYIKSSEGSNFVDPYFEKNYLNAKANGLYIGVYHYVRARTVEQAKIEAQFFVSLFSKTQIATLMLTILRPLLLSGSAQCVPGALACCCPCSIPASCPAKRQAEC